MAEENKNRFYLTKQLAPTQKREGVLTINDLLDKGEKGDVTAIYYIIQLVNKDKYDPVRGINIKKYSLDQDLSKKLEKILKSTIYEGSAKAQYCLGCCMLMKWRDSFPKEFAIQLLTLAADQKLAEAEYLLGQCYELGYAVTQDNKKALYCYQLAAFQGYPVAQYFLGRNINETPWVEISQWYITPIQLIFDAAIHNLLKHNLRWENLNSLGQ